MIRDGRVLRLLVTNWVAGVVLGCAFALALLMFDVGGLASLIRSSDSAPAAIALLFGGFSITCGGVVCASAVMIGAGRDSAPRDHGPTGAVAVAVRRASAGRQVPGERARSSWE